MAPSCFISSSPSWIFLAQGYVCIISDIFIALLAGSFLALWICDTARFVSLSLLSFYLYLFFSFGFGTYILQIRYILGTRIRYASFFVSSLSLLSLSLLSPPSLPFLLLVLFPPLSLLSPSSLPPLSLLSIFFFLFLHISQPTHILELYLPYGQYASGYGLALDLVYHSLYFSFVPTFGYEYDWVSLRYRPWIL